MNNRFNFRCWVEGEFPKLVPNYDGEHTEYVYCDKAYGYYIYSDTISDGRVQANIEDVKYVCGLNEADFASYCDYLVYNKIDIHGQIWLDGIVEQCTGAKDKNGKLIYEGDILEGCCYRCVVKWNERLSGFYCSADDKTCFSLTGYLTENSLIIGNIHENPELLNG